MIRCLVLFILLVAACSDDRSPPMPDASIGDAAADSIAPADSSVPGDSSVPSDTSVPDDTSPPTDSCSPESDAVLCERASAECGTFEATDACGTRTVDCGGCPMLEACGVEAPNQCDNERWALTLIDDSGDVGKEVSLAIDAADGLHVAYRLDEGGVSGDLRYAERTGATWSTETLDSGTIAGRHTTIAIDGAGVVHVAAPAGSLSPVRAIDLHRRGASGWTSEMVPGTADGRLSLTFDGSDRAHFCAHEPAGSGVGGFLSHIAEQSDGSWNRITIDGSVASSSRTGDHCTIAFDGTRFRSAYHDGTFMRLELATRTTGAWSPEVVDEVSGDSAGDYASMVLDGSGDPVIAYRALSVSGREIRLARPGSSGWDITTVDDDAGTIANFTSVAVDASDRAHVSYFDSRTPGTIRYARETASGFTLEDVTVVGTGTGGHSAIGVDSTGAVHIVYYDVDSASLYHATPR